MKIEEEKNFTKITADEGKVFYRKMSKVAYIAKNDSLNNYIEVDEPVEPKEQNANEQTNKLT